MPKGITKSFLPWIAFFMVVGPVQLQLEIATILGLIIFLAMNRHGLQKGFLLDWGTGLFFVIILFVTSFFEPPWLEKNILLCAYGSLALIAWVSIIIGKPFFWQYSKQEIIDSNHQIALYRKVNLIVSIVWGIAFTVAAIITILWTYRLGVYFGVIESLADISLVLAIWFTFWFPVWYEKRALS